MRKFFDVFYRFPIVKNLQVVKRLIGIAMSVSARIS